MARVRRVHKLELTRAQGGKKKSGVGKKKTEKKKFEVCVSAPSLPLVSPDALTHRCSPPTGVIQRKLHFLCSHQHSGKKSSNKVQSGLSIIVDHLCVTLANVKKATFKLRYYPLKQNLQNSSAK